jgi:hypothetical protein
VQIDDGEVGGADDPDEVLAEIEQLSRFLDGTATRRTSSQPIGALLAATALDLPCAAIRGAPKHPADRSRELDPNHARAP